MGYWLLLFLLFCGGLQAQQYIIRYDLAGENVKYFQVKKRGDTAETSIIHFSQTNQVNLQLVNSASSYRREINYINRVEIPEPIIIPGLGSAPLKTLETGLASLDIKTLKPGDIFKSANINKGFEILAETDQQKALQQEFVNRYNNFSAAYESWQQALYFEQNCEVLWKDLAGLRYDMQSPASEVKKAARQKTQAFFPGIINDNPSTILSAAKSMNPSAMAVAVKTNYKALTETYSVFKEFEIKSVHADSLVSSATKKMYAVNNTTTEKNIDDVVGRITNLYRQIVNDNYTYMTPLNVTRNTIMAEIRFTPVIDSVTATALNIGSRDTIKRWIPIYKKEPLRFRNTFGFSFVSFAENRWHYYVRPDSVVAKETADQFQPVIVTYLHFYSPRDKGFRWGGSFGAGLPVGGDNTKLNLMLGLSTFLGKGDPVCITAGVSGTQLKKLSGLKEGDKINAAELSDRNYSSVYRVGYFISLTFNPGSLNLNN
ncbi:MAG TPA: hypothetical protein VN451_11250 [Chitinophagaceae bacterium]|nr:hypothetical protein [Chitinophagaceae bacterium]